MASKQLVLAIFDSEAAADTAAEELKSWDKATDDIKLKSVGVLVLDDKGKVKVDKVGRRSTLKGAGIGIILAMVMPIGLAAGIIGGGILGALHRKGLGIDGRGPRASRSRAGQRQGGRRCRLGLLGDGGDLQQAV